MQYFEYLSSTKHLQGQPHWRKIINYFVLIVAHSHMQHHEWCHDGRTDVKPYRTTFTRA